MTRTSVETVDERRARDEHVDDAPLVARSDAAQRRSARRSIRRTTVDVNVDTDTDARYGRPGDECERE